MPKSIIFATILVLPLIIAISTLTFFQTSQPWTDQTPLPNFLQAPKTFSLEKFSSCKDIQNEVRNFYQRNTNFTSNTGRENENFQSFQMSGNSVAERNSADFSTTNNQVADVDEGDIVKTDGKYIYSLRKNMDLRISKIDSKGNLQSWKYRLDLPSTKTNLHLYKDTLFISGQNSNKTYVRLLKIPDNLDKLDSNNYVQLPIIKSFSYEGNILQTRMVNNKIYLVSTASQGGYYKEMSERQAEENIPSFIENDQKKSAISNCNEIQYIKPISNPSQFTTVLALDLDKSGEVVDRTTILGGGQNLYSSNQNLYLAQYNYANYDFNSNSNSTESTTIFKFSLGNSLKLEARADVEGKLLNQFAMDEYEGNLRVATTINRRILANNRECGIDNNCASPNQICDPRSNCVSMSGQNSSSSSVFILNEKLQKLSQLDGLGKNERIYAVRYVGKNAFVVTFRQTDPLYTLDLDSQNPKVLGELKIPGFSNYLHPINQNLLIGVGQEATNSGSSLGVKLSLFDVSDLTQPREIDTKVIGLQGSSSLVNTDHKAFLWDSSRDLLALPIQVVDSKGIIGTSVNYQGSYIYAVNKNGFQLRGRVSHLQDKKDDRIIQELDEFGQLEKIDQTKNPIQKDMNSNYFITRQMYIDNFLITFSPSLIQSHNINTLQKVGEISD